MKILGLPGKDPATERWLHDILDTIDLKQKSVSIQRYGCWKTPGSDLDLEKELAAANRECPNTIVAKSIGVRVSLHGYASGALVAEAYVLIGTPLRAMDDEERSTLNQLCAKVPTLLIQNRKDPTGSCTELRGVLTTPDQAQIVERPADDHWYGETDALRDTIEVWYEDCVVRDR